MECSKVLALIPPAPEISPGDNLLAHIPIPVFLRLNLKQSEIRCASLGRAVSQQLSSFNLYQDLLCIKLVGFCVNQEERGPVSINHFLGLIETLDDQRVHTRHLGKNRPGNLI